MKNDLAVATGTVTALPAGPSIYMDGATHAIETVTGSIRLHAVDSAVLSDLNIVADGVTPVLVVGIYRNVEAVMILVTEVARIGISPNIFGLDAEGPGDGDGPFPLQPVTGPDPGDAWPWNSLQKLNQPVQREVQSTAHVALEEGQLTLRVHSSDLISDNCHHPVAAPVLDPFFSPHTFKVVVNLKKEGDVCALVEIPREEEWDLPPYRNNLLGAVRHVQIIHSSGPTEMIEVRRL